jgi:hypothetical protein
LYVFFVCFFDFCQKIGFKMCDFVVIFV